MTAAFEQAIALAPADVAEALQGQSDGLWFTPEETQAKPPGVSGREQDTIDVFAVEQCGTSVFDARITPESPQPIDPATVAQTLLGSDYLPDRPSLTAEAGGTTIRWRMPRINLIDGPRPPRNLDPPAEVTIWSYGGAGVDLRYDATLITGLAGLGANDDEIARAALSRFNGGTPIRMLTSKRSNGRLELPYQEQAVDRVWFGLAYSWDGNLFTVSVGVPWNREDLTDAAQIELARFNLSVVFE